MEVRRVESASDVREVLRAHGRAWRAAYDGILPEDLIAEVASPPTDREVRERFETARRARGYLVAECEGRVVGYVYVRCRAWGERPKAFVGEDAAGLKELYVDPDWWGRGVATALVERAIEALPEDVERLTLETLADNDVGRGFYESRGFAAVDEIQIELGKGTYAAVVYTRPVDASSE